MALSIKDAETDRLVRRYAALKGTSFTGAIRLAVGEALDRDAAAIDSDARNADFLERVRAIQERVATYDRLPISDDDIIGYDAFGAPR